MDFIFGTLATDALKMIHHKASRRGIQHHYHLNPRDPKPGEAVTLTVQTGADFAAEGVACYYTTDSSVPEGERGMASNGQVVNLNPIGTLWDTLSWGYMTLWQGVLPPQPEGVVVRYRISGWIENGAEIFADTPNISLTAEAAASAFFKGEDLPEGFVPRHDPNLFSYHVDHLTVPAWAQEAIIYHVFVDRFYPGDGMDWLQKDDLMGICGGTLWGVRDKLDYITDLGANCIWLSPTWVAPSHHGYDATDYDNVEERLGGNEALKALVKAAHERGVRVLLDLACNHISHEHPIFKSAVSDHNSPYRRWFHFDESEIGYRTFFGVATMPQVNLDFPPAREWMISIARYWLREYDVDGYRLDYANGPGPDFWGDFRAACREIKPDALCFGEVIDAPDVLQHYIGRLDGCLDFHLGDALRRTYGWQTWSEADFNHFATRHHAYFPRDFFMPLFLDNHDMDRFLFIAKGDKAALKKAAAVQMRMPNPPIIFYGTEVGLSQPVSAHSGAGLHVSRTPMFWGEEQDTDLLEYYKGLIRERQTRK